MENELVIRLFLSVALGALIGLEREFTQKSAGLRTHILVTLGATIFTLVSLSDFYQGIHLPFSLDEDNRIIRDPSRVAAQIIAGIGFIGGGAVLRYGNTVRGLTTAASLWTMASIGMLVGIGHYYLATVSTLMIFLVLFTIGKVERSFFRKPIHAFNRLRLNLCVSSEHLANIQAWVEAHYHNHVLETEVKAEENKEHCDIQYILAVIPGRVDINTMSRDLCRQPGVLSTNTKTYYQKDDVGH